MKCGKARDFLSRALPVFYSLFILPDRSDLPGILRCSPVDGRAPVFIHISRIERKLTREAVGVGHIRKALREPEDVLRFFFYRSYVYDQPLVMAAALIMIVVCFSRLYFVLADLGAAIARLFGGSACHFEKLSFCQLMMLIHSIHSVHVLSIVV